MKFIHHDLGQRGAGEIVEVTLTGNAANVLLLDSSNLSAYQHGRRYSYFGGHYRRSPVRLQIPRTGHWHVAVDLGGYQGRVGSSVRILPGLLPPGRSLTPGLAEIGANVAELMGSGDDREFDVFISHASEDKDSFARPLAHALREQGLTVWYDEFELRIGDSLRRKIDSGLANSRFGIVVFSRAFFSKNWPQYELDGLVTRQMTGQQVVLPIWHDITKDEIMRHSPSLADKVALSTGVLSVEEIAAQIAAVVRSPTEQSADG